MRVCVTQSTQLAGDHHYSAPPCMTDYEYPWQHMHRFKVWTMKGHKKLMEFLADMG